MVGAVDVLAVQFSAGASGYPWTWAHLSDDQKVDISARACDGKLQLVREATTRVRRVSRAAVRVALHALASRRTGTTPSS